MKTENKARRKTMSCGGLPWRIHREQLEVLLIKQFKHKDSWGIPKGHLHSGETPEACAIREIREETGVEVALGTRLPDVGTVFQDEDKTVVSWLARPTGDDEPNLDNPDNEVADAKWFNVDSLPTIHLYQRPLIAAAVEILKTTVERVENRYHPMQPPEPKRG